VSHDRPNHLKKLGTTAILAGKLPSAEGDTYHTTVNLSVLMW